MKDHRVAAFATLLDSARAYAMNLNTHAAYGEFRPVADGWTRRWRRSRRPCLLIGVEY